MISTDTINSFWIRSALYPYTSLYMTYWNMNLTAVRVPASVELIFL